jgi:hypothetical protein
MLNFRRHASKLGLARTLPCPTGVHLRFYLGSARDRPGKQGHAYNSAAAPRSGTRPITSAPFECISQSHPTELASHPS